MARAKRRWFADFETTQEDENGVEVYLWCMVSGSKVLHGTDIKSFVDTVIKMNIILYFHNLKFDWSYVEDYILRNDIKYDKLEKGGQVYQCKLGNAKFRDTMNYWSMSLKQVGKSYCKNYQKTSIETLLVGRGHKYTQEELEYCINDCRVIEEAFENYFSSLEDVLEKAIVANNEDEEKKKQKIISGCRDRLTNAGLAFEVIRAMSDFDALCLEQRTTQSEYHLLKEAYKGGYVYSNAEMGLVKGVKMGDINSLYPYVYSCKELPYGKHIEVDNEADLGLYGFYVIEVNIKFDLKKGMIPIIGGSTGKYCSALYSSTSNGIFERRKFTSVDWKWVKELYHIEYSFIRAYCWNTRENFFIDYVDTFNEVKVSFKDERRNVAKILLNSPYGKMAMNGDNEIKHWHIDEKTDVVVGDVVGWETDDDGFKYLPMGMAITAYARNELLSEAYKIGFDKVVYMDTDSIKFIDDPNNPYDTKDWDPDRLGAWKDEGYADYFKTIAPKKYVYYEKCKISYTCAGFSKDMLSEYMNHNKIVDGISALHYINKFSSGLTLPNLQQRVVKGGRSLRLVDKTMT